MCIRDRYNINGAEKKVDEGEKQSGIIIGGRRRRNSKKSKREKE